VKVDDPKLTGMSPSQVGGTQAPDSVSVRPKKTDPGPGNSRDEVSLSDLGTKLRQFDSESPERAARLEQLAAEVAAGRYSVDPMKVSDRMIEDALRPDNVPPSDTKPAAGE
jgi:flagellar biosynthesis anti-sigma factor FlgM